MGDNVNLNIDYDNGGDNDGGDNDGNDADDNDDGDANCDYNQDYEC